MIFSLDDTPPSAPFPETHLAETEPNGLLAVGGDLSVTRLVNAYRHGIFPWFNQGDPILWWSPNPRLILYPDKFICRKSLMKKIRNSGFELRINHRFSDTIQACAQPRAKQADTWIVPEMKTAYLSLHKEGYAHSVEIWEDNMLVGGLYGIVIGQVFFGESMFSRVTDASKVALACICELFLKWDIRLIDCQVYSDHLASLGAEEIERQQFITYLQELTVNTNGNNNWLEFPATLTNTLFK